MRIGYARLPTEDQDLGLQINALKAAGFTDYGISGRGVARPVLDAAFSFVNDGDTLLVWRLDRLGRFLSSLLN